LSKQRGLAQGLQRERREKQRDGKICRKSWRVANGDILRRAHEQQPVPHILRASLDVGGTGNEVANAAGHIDRDQDDGADGKVE
jgi:hypothetical protein